MIQARRATLGWSVAWGSQAVLAAVLLLVGLTWHHPDAFARVATVAIGAGGLGAAVAVWARTGIRWPLVAVDLWFAAYGVLLFGRNPCINVLGQCDLPESEFAEAAQLNHLLDPIWLQIPTGILAVIAGLAGAVAVVRASRHAADREAIQPAR
jgi:hypothetical protein